MRSAPTLLARHAFVDIETTGLDPSTDEIIEVGVVFVEQGRVVQRASWVMRPHGPLPAIITVLTGLTEGDVADAPPFAAVAREIHAALDGWTLVAHNGAFEQSFLGEVVAGLPMIDSCALLHLLFPELEHHSLDALVRWADVGSAAQHRAVHDAEDTFAVVAHALDRVVREGRQPDAAEAASWLPESPLQAFLAALGADRGEEPGSDQERPTRLGRRAGPLSGLRPRPREEARGAHREALDSARAERSGQVLLGTCPEERSPRACRGARDSAQADLSGQVLLGSCPEEGPPAAQPEKRGPAVHGWSDFAAQDRGPAVPNPSESPPGPAAALPAATTLHPLFAAWLGAARAAAAESESARLEADVLAEARRWAAADAAPISIAAPSGQLAALRGSTGLPVVLPAGQAACASRWRRLRPAVEAATAALPSRDADGLRLAAAYLSVWLRHTQTGDPKELSFWLAERAPGLRWLASACRCEGADCELDCTAVGARAEAKGARVLLLSHEEALARLEAGDAGRLVVLDAGAFAAAARRHSTYSLDGRRVAAVAAGVEVLGERDPQVRSAATTLRLRARELEEALAHGRAALAGAIDTHARHQPPWLRLRDAVSAVSHDLGLLIAALSHLGANGDHRRAESGAQDRSPAESAHPAQPERSRGPLDRIGANDDHPRAGSGAQLGTGPFPAALLREARELAETVGQVLAPPAPGFELALPPGWKTPTLVSWARTATVAAAWGPRLHAARVLLLGTARTAPPHAWLAALGLPEVELAPGEDVTGPRPEVLIISEALPHSVVASRVTSLARLASEPLLVLGRALEPLARLFTEAAAPAGVPVRVAGSAPPLAPQVMLEVWKGRRTATAGASLAVLLAEAAPAEVRAFLLGPARAVSRLVVQVADRRAAEALEALLEGFRVRQVTWTDVLWFSAGAGHPKREAAATLH